MVNYFLIFNNCCIYEIVILSYFMKYTNQDIKFCTLDGDSIQCAEGFSVLADIALRDINVESVNSIIIPGGEITNINIVEVYSLLKSLKTHNKLIAAICAGVDVLDNAGILNDLHSTHSDEVDMINDNKVITARANAYVDFAIEVAKELKLFVDEQDIKETIDFWKYHKRM